MGFADDGTLCNQSISLMIQLYNRYLFKDHTVPLAVAPPPLPLIVHHDVGAEVKVHTLPISADTKHIGRDPLDSWEPPTIAPQGSRSCVLSAHSEQSTILKGGIKPSKVANVAPVVHKLILGWPREGSLQKPVVPGHNQIKKGSILNQYY